MPPVLNTETMGLIVLFGAIQGFVLATVLLRHRPLSTANRLLGGLIFLFALDMVFVYALDTIDYRRVPGLIGVSDPFTLLYGPLLYLYARTVATGAPLRRRDWLHGLPAAAHALSLIPIFLATAPEKIAYWESVLSSGLGWRTSVTATLNLGLSFVYLFCAHRLTLRHRRAIRDRFSNLDRITLDWLRFLTGSALGLWLIAMLLFAIQSLGVDMGETFGFAYIGITVLIYAIGWFGLRQPTIFGVAAPETAAPASEPAKYEKTRLDPETAEGHREALLAHMERDHPYRRSGLTLHELAEELGLPAHRLSQVINDRLGVNFYDFVNGYRVEEVKRRLTDPAATHLTVLSLALDAGFSSKSAFNAIFKKHTGQTPSAFRKSTGAS